jgi:hypothetical protein
MPPKTLILAYGPYRFWKMGGQYCVVKGTDEAPPTGQFCYSSLKYLYDMKCIPMAHRPRQS